MTLALATRGYLCTGGAGGGDIRCGPGPGIVSTEMIMPGIDGSAVERTPTPSLTGAGVQGPEISGAAGPEQEPAGDSPTISGGGVLKPEGSGK